MPRQKSDLHREEEDYPRIAGNMILLSRDTVSGYKLKCSCEHEFMYLPGGLNSIETVRHPSDKTIKPADMVKRRTAICPECQCLWNESAEFKHRPGSVYFGYFVTTEENKEPQLVGIGRETSHCAAASHAAHEVKLSDIKFINLIVTIFSEEEFNQTRDRIRRVNGLTKMSLLGALAGVNFSEILGKINDPKKTRG